MRFSPSGDPPRLAFLLATLTCLAAATSPAVADPPPPPPAITVTFTLDPARFKDVYECEVTTTLHPKDAKLRGSVRPTPGSDFPTINAGEYRVSLGLHYRKEDKMRDPRVLTAAEYEAVKSSKRAFGATTKKYLAKYVKQADGAYHLPDGQSAALGWMRKVLTVADPAADAVVIEAAAGKPRLALVLEGDADKVPVTRPIAGSDERKPGTAALVHVHSGPDAKRGAEGCLTIPAKEWEEFLTPIAAKYPCADDWVLNGYVGTEIGNLIVTVKKK